MRKRASQHSRRRRPPGPSYAIFRLVSTLRTVKVFRRVMLALGIAALVGLLAKLRGKGGVPPTSGGWRELEGPQFN